MAYVLYTPPQHDDRSFYPSSGRRERAVGRVWGPMRTGFTQYRIGGTWRQKAVPTTDESVSVDTDTDGQTLFLRGGHYHWIREELLAEIEGDGLVLGPYLAGFYPSPTTYPAANAYPGA